MSDTSPDLWEVTLTGPVSFGPASVLHSLLPWNRPMWRQIKIQMQVGSDECPDWDHVNLCMTAIQDMIIASDGLISDEVLDALQAHLDVVDIRTFRGPPSE
jgi:hypothetical protein